MRAAGLGLALLLTACPSKTRWQPVLTVEGAPFAERFASAPTHLFTSAKATWFGEGQRIKGEIGLVLAAPDKLYLEVRGPGGVPVSTFTCDGTRAQLYDMEGPNFLEGPASAHSLGRVLPLPLPPALAVDLLRGKLPLPEGGVYQRAGELLALTGEHPELGSLRIERRGEDYTWSLPAEAISVRFSEGAPGQPFARVELRHGDAELSLRFFETSTGGDPPGAAIFSLHRPAGLSAQPF
jgi:hypothetical protein